MKTFYNVFKIDFKIPITLISYGIKPLILFFSFSLSLPIINIILAGCLKKGILFKLKKLLSVYLKL